jgi:hypothetical protein
MVQFLHMIPHVLEHVYPVYEGRNVGYAARNVSHRQPQSLELGRRGDILFCNTKPKRSVKIRAIGRDMHPRCLCDINLEPNGYEPDHHFNASGNEEEFWGQFVVDKHHDFGAGHN